MDIHRLRVFRSVVASGSVQAAAHHLGYTPSAVSQQLKALQTETGLTLFERVGRGIVPTPAGTLLAAHSDEAMTALTRLDGIVDNLRSGRTGQLSIGCFASAGEEWIPRVAGRLHEEFPDVELTIDLTEIRASEAKQPPVSDLEIRTEMPGESLPLPAAYTRVELVTEPYYVVVSADHPLASRARVSLAELAEETWIDESTAEQTCGRILRRALRSAGIVPRYAARCQDHHTSMALAAAGVGVTLAPELTMGALPDGTRALPVADPTPERRIAVLVRDTASGNPVAHRALELLGEVARRPRPR